LRGNMLDKAESRFHLAHEKFPEYFAKEMGPVLNDFLQKEDYEKALLVGLIILKAQKEDFRLANTLGNCARRLKNYQQANNLYRLALRTNNEFNQAFYNFAASLARVEKYDLEIQLLVEEYLLSEQFVLPSCVPQSDCVDELIDDLTCQNEARKVREIQHLIKEENRLEMKGEIKAAEEIENKIIICQKRENKPGYKQITIALQKSAQEAEENFDSSIEKLENLPWQHQIYNLGLFAFQNKDIQLAQKCFKDLKNEQSSLPYVGMLNALIYDLRGKRDKAIVDLLQLLKENGKDRFININLGLIYRRANNRLLTYKYLLAGSVLLEDSEGMFSLKEIFQLAKKTLDQGELKRALKLFLLIVDESESIEAWAKIGDIYWQTLEEENAIQAYKQILKVDPKSRLGYIKLRKIHDNFCKKALIFTEASKFNLAVLEYDKALKVLKVTDTLKKASDAYKVIDKRAISLNLKIEYKEALAGDKKKEDEILRQKLIEKGKEYLRAKNIQPAIRCFENAFDMKADKDVFMFLVYIYKNLKRKEALNHLIKRWHKMVKHDAKLKRFKVR